MAKALRTCLFFVLVLGPAAADCAVNLYGSKGVTPQAVQQGSLGSCFFHASIASLAAVRPDLLRQTIQQDAKGNLSVRFADGKLENVYLDDVQYARSSGYDQSDGLWVAVLFRGYAQRTLRAALLTALEKSALPATFKLPMTGFVKSSDFVLLAYDRAIRSQIDQEGNISRNRLKARLREELAVVPVGAAWKERAVQMVDSSGFLESITAAVKANGELFGAYRAVGQGGLPERVLNAFAGASRSYTIGPAQANVAAIESALRNRQAVVIWTGQSYTPPSPADWYIPVHAYSVLAVNPQQGTLAVRNPWGHHPEPAGEFTLPLEVFSSAYAGLSTSAPNPGT